MTEIEKIIKQNNQLSDALRNLKNKLCCEESREVADDGSQPKRHASGHTNEIPTAVDLQAVINNRFKDDSI